MDGIQARPEQQKITLTNFSRHLAKLVSFPTESESPSQAPALWSYLKDALAPILEAMGFEVSVYDNPKSAGGPILVATRIEDEAFPTILTYGHGDVVVGMEGQWAEGRDPYVLDDAGDRYFGRGTADNKGQHLLNILALQQVLDEQDGKLGYNFKFLIETSEEIGSLGLREFAEGNQALLASDVLIASDGPRVANNVPTICLGHRGVMNFSLEVSLRTEAHHSGSWGGFIADPAVILAHAIACISTKDGKLNVPEWRPKSLDPAMRKALEGCPFDPGDAADTPHDNWGEPGLTLWEKNALWPSYTVLAIDHGDPSHPVNAVQHKAKALCGIRFPKSIDQDDILPALQRHLDAHGLADVKVVHDDSTEDFPATYLDPETEWVAWAAASIERSLGKPAQVLPSSGGSLPNDIFTDVLGLETLWIPHSYNSCCQHAPDEHLLKPLVEEGFIMMAGIWRDLSTKAAQK